MTLDLFRTINKIYTSSDVGFINDIDDSVSPVVINLTA